MFLILAISKTTLANPCDDALSKLIGSADVERLSHGIVKKMHQVDYSPSQRTVLTNSYVFEDGTIAIALNMVKNRTPEGRLALISPRGIESIVEIKTNGKNILGPFQGAVLTHAGSQHLFIGGSACF